VNPKLRYRNDATAELLIDGKTILLTPEQCQWISDNHEQFAIMAITIRHTERVAS
jgi:hypothetical protein